MSARILGKENYHIISLRDKFPVNTKDIDIITALNREGGWIFISGDMRITKNKTERHIFRNANIIGIFLSKGLYKAPNAKKAARLIMMWEVIERVCSNVAPGAMFELQMKSSKLEQIR